jgi:hypothetical protein
VVVLSLAKVNIPQKEDDLRKDVIDFVSLEIDEGKSFRHIQKSVVKKKTAEGLFR